MSDLRGLIESCEKAVGPDRELDGELCLALGYIGYVDAPLNLRRSADDDGWLDYEVVEDSKLIDCTDRTPALTASIDTALALVEKMRPETDYLINSRGNYACIWDSKESGRHGSWEANAATLPLAIILALLRSLDTDNKGAAHGAP